MERDPISKRDAKCRNADAYDETHGISRKRSRNRGEARRAYVPKISFYSVILSDYEGAL